MVAGAPTVREVVVVTCLVAMTRLVLLTGIVTCVTTLTLGETVTVGGTLTVDETVTVGETFTVDETVTVGEGVGSLKSAPLCAGGALSACDRVDPATAATAMPAATTAATVPPTAMRCCLVSRASVLLPIGRPARGDPRRAQVFFPTRGDLNRTEDFGC